MEELRESTHRLKASSRVLSLDGLQARLEATAEEGYRGGSAGLLLVELQPLESGEPALDVGEELESLLRVVRQNDVIAQIEEHTYAVLFSGLATWKDARLVAERVQHALARATGKEVRLGLAVLGKGNIDITDLWAQARRDLEQPPLAGSRRLASPTETLRVRGTG